MLRIQILKNPTRENFLQLQKLIQNDILDSIDANLKVGNILADDANLLLELTNQLYEHLYKHYFEKGGRQDMKPLLDGALELPMDKYRIQIDELEEKIAENTEQLVKAEADKVAVKEQLAKSEADAKQEIELLQQRIKELERNVK